MSTNYFTCTLGEAAREQSVARYQNVNHLIDVQSEEHPKLPAVGFIKVQQGRSQPTYHYEILNFSHIQQAVAYAAQLLSKILNTARGDAVALLCSSSPEFLFTWLGCVALGYPVLLIAPECSSRDVAYLCKSCSVSELLVDAPNRILGEEACETRLEGAAAGLRCIDQPFEGKDVFEVLKAGLRSNFRSVTPQNFDAAYFHHTSGTSGTPKPIMQSHHGAVGVLPVFNGSKEATFTTTPLFHGGPADVFRAWTSNAMIWLFPSKDVPITASNITKCLDCVHQATVDNSIPAVKYFASVPYVLESILDNEDALYRLRNMDLVSVGGAALSQGVGDSLVKECVNLVSRFGSAECGFLLSSHRNYDKDTEWQYLRWNNQPSYLVFEPRADGLSELVVLQKWPHLAKSNRNDGSYATSDLFEPHPSLKGAWRYHSRADAQLTLSTGKKFDADQVERSLLAGSESLSDVFVFGNDRPYPGALLFRSHEASDLTDAELVDDVLPAVERTNAATQSHAAIASSMLIPLPYDTNAVDRSSKGTVLRKRVEERYRDLISNAYGPRIAAKSPADDKDLLETIHNIVTQAVSRKQNSLETTTDLYSFGVDSIAGMHIRHSLQTLLPEDAKRLPVDIIEDCGSIKALADYLENIRNGRVVDANGAANEESIEMRNLVEQYSKFTEAEHTPQDTLTISIAKEERHVVVLTGATGALGAHVLNFLRQSPTVSKIYCLVRGADSQSASERVRKALLERRMESLDKDDSKVTVLRATLDRDDLGLDNATYAEIAQNVTVILHLAWSVNFQMKLRSFVKDNISGLRNLIQLALRSPQAACPRFAFCSSTASAISSSSDPVPEALLIDPSSASTTGYAKSKWVAEQICQRADEDTPLRGKVSIFRVGQLSGDGKTGIWNSRDAWPMMLSTIGLVGCLPDLGDEPLQWLPVDVAAQAIIQGALGTAQKRSPDVFHVLNNSLKLTWNDLVRSLHHFATFKIVPPAQWIKQLEQAVREGSNDPSLQLVDFWKSTFATSDRQSDQPKAFSMDNTMAVMPIMGETPSIDEDYFHKMWKWINSTMIVQRSKKYAYSTLITRASYLAGVIVLAYTLCKHGSQYPLIVFYTSSLSASAVRVLEEEARTLNLIPKFCELLLPPDHDKMSLIAQRFADTWTKLRVFETYDYDAVCYLDADMAIFNNNMDDVFRYFDDMPFDHIAANHICCCNLDKDAWAPEDWHKENCAYTPLSHPSALFHPTPVLHGSRPTHRKLNGGLFLYRPTQELWNSMMDVFHKSEKLQHYMFPDQDFLADFFEGRWQSIGWQWNALKTMRYWHPNIWRDTEVRNLHYIVDKPWAATIGTDGRAGHKGRDGEAHRWWWAEYFEWQEVKRQAGKQDLLAAVGEHVASRDGVWSKDSDMIAISPPNHSKD